MKKRNWTLLFLFTGIIVFSINVYADGCSNGSGLSNFLNELNEYIYKPIKYGTPILLLVLTAFDFAKVVFSGDGKGMSKATNNFLKRSIAALIIFFAPDIIRLIAELAENDSITSCIPN